MDSGCSNMHILHVRKATSPYLQYDNLLSVVLTKKKGKSFLSPMFLQVTL